MPPALPNSLNAPAHPALQAPTKYGESTPGVPRSPQSPESPESDESLYARTRRGDLGAFDTLYGRYESRLFGFLCHLVRSPHDAEDLFHETFLSVLRSREVTFDRGCFAAWLYRVARNRALNHLRSGQRGAACVRRLELPETAPSAEISIYERERAAVLAAAVATLPEGLSELYRMRTAGLSYDEMAAALRVPLGTVKSRMNQMTTRLRRTVAEQLGLDDDHSVPLPAELGPVSIPDDLAAAATERSRLADR